MNSNKVTGPTLVWKCGCYSISNWVIVCDFCSLPQWILCYSNTWFFKEKYPILAKAREIYRANDAQLVYNVFVKNFPICSWLYSSIILHELYCLVCWNYFSANVCWNTYETNWRYCAKLSFTFCYCIMSCNCSTIDSRNKISKYFDQKSSRD